MKLRRIRLQVAFLIFILLPAMAGVVAVHASAACERFVRTYVTRPVRNVVSKGTADAWAKWRIAHPEWKPNPNLHRPRYVMNREETIEKVAFACELPATASHPEALLSQSDLPDPPPVITTPLMADPQITFPEVVLPELAIATPLSVLPEAPQWNTLVAVATPEPSTLMLVGSGLCLMLLWMRGRSHPSQA